MAKLIIKTEGNSVQIGANVYQKGKLTYSKCPTGIIISGREYKYQDVECDGIVHVSVEELYTWLNANLFKNGGGDGGSGSQDDYVLKTDLAMTPLGDKVPKYSSQGMLSTNFALFPENAVPLAQLEVMLGRQGSMNLNEGASEYVNLDDVGELNINVDGEGAKITFASLVDGYKYLKLNIFNGFEISTKFFDGILNEGDIDIVLPSEGININGGYAELIYHTHDNRSRIFRLTISNSGTNATWSDRPM